MTARLLTHLRHVDLAVPDFRRQLDFYAGIWGLREAAGEDGLSFLAAEGSPEQFIVRLRQDDDKRLDLISFGAETAADVDDLAQQLARSGVRLISEPGSLQGPGGGYGFRFFDLDGRTLEVSSDVSLGPSRKIEARESIPVRLSHCVVNTPDPTATRDWYVRHLGFRLSDSIRHPTDGDLMHFMRINPLHHSIGFARGPHTSLHHVSFELRGLDEFMRGTGRLLKAGHRLIWGPGRHVAGDNAYSYWSDPHGNTVEYTTALELIDEDVWHPSVYDAETGESDDQWGTANPMSEYMQGLSVNDKDPGLFVAPPV